MNLHEVYAQLMEEKRKLDWKRDSLLQKAVKDIRRQGTFPAWTMYSYNVPSSNNQYVIYFHAHHPFSGIMADYLCLLYDDNKRYVIKWATSEVPEILVLTSHFLQRYRDRFLNDSSLSANEVAVRFLTRNDEMHPVPIDERINRHINRYEDYAGKGFLVQDGFCFKLSGEERGEDGTTIRLSLFTTFMPTSEMSSVQREAIFDECMSSLRPLS